MRVFTEEENQSWSKTLPGKMCSACLILRHGDKVLMVKAGYKDHWTFPSGIVDDGESPKSAALREAREEVGINIDFNQAELFTIIYTAASGGDRDRFNFSFEAILPTLDGIEISVPNDEIEKAEWVNIENVAERANQRGSYKRLQEALLNGPGNRYVEVHN